MPRQEFVVDAVLMSKSAQRPVKVMWTREDDVHNGHFRPITAHYLRAGLDASGKLIAYHQRVVGDRVLPFEGPEFFRANHERDYQLMGGVELTCYDIPNQYGGQIPRDTGVRTAARHRRHPNQVCGGSITGTSRVMRKPRWRRPQ